jgi:hypothetical protein
MRKFQHLAQLSDEELQQCLDRVWMQMEQLKEKALVPESGLESMKYLHSELRHQQRVYNLLNHFVYMRGF